MSDVAWWAAPLLYGESSVNLPIFLSSDTESGSKSLENGDPDPVSSSKFLGSGNSRRLSPAVFVLGITGAFPLRPPDSSLGVDQGEVQERSGAISTQASASPSGTGGNEFEVQEVPESWREDKIVQIEQVFRPIQFWAKNEEQGKEGNHQHRKQLLKDLFPFEKTVDFRIAHTFIVSTDEKGRKVEHHWRSSGYELDFYDPQRAGGTLAKRAAVVTGILFSASAFVAGGEVRYPDRKKMSVSITYELIRQHIPSRGPYNFLSNNCMHASNRVWQAAAQATSSRL